jgi:hypothetical protein
LEPAGNFERGPTLGALDKALAQIDRQCELQPQRAEQVRRLEAEL